MTTSPRLLYFAVCISGSSLATSEAGEIMVTTWLHRSIEMFYLAIHVQFHTTKL